jgi:heat shock protein HslJ
MTRKVNAALLSCVLIVVTILAACSGPTAPAVELSRDPALLVDGTWKLQQSVLPSGFSVRATATLTAHFNPNGHVGGYAGPNSYSGTYVAGRDGTIALSEVISTLIGGSEAERAGAYQYRMMRAAEFEVGEGELRLYSADGGYLLFRRDVLRLLDRSARQGALER